MSNDLLRSLFGATLGNAGDVGPLGVGPIIVHSEGGKTGELELQVRQLEDDIGALKLLNAAMLELLVEKGGITLVEIQSKALEIDARDGVVDGKITRVTAKCGSCGKTLMKGRKKCAYCGKEN